MRLQYLLLASLILPVAAHAEEEGPVIVVTGRGLDATPATPAYDTVVLDREEITRTASGRLEDALSNIAGFQQFRRSDSRSSNPTAQGATLRALGGNATSRALVLLDGVPMLDPFFGYVPFSAIAPERLDSIRVTRGGGSGPFGSGALAGTIELDSANAATLGLLNGQALVNNRGETELSGTLAPQVGDGFAVVSGRWDRGQGFYTTPDNQRVPATARARYDSWSASGRLVQPLGDSLELQLRGLAFEDNRTLRFDGADSGITGQDVSARLVSRGPWQVDAVAYAQWRNFSNIVISSSQFTPVLDQKDTPASGQGGKLEVRPPVGPDHVLRLGADFRRAEGDLKEDALSAFSGLRTEERFAGGVNTDLGLFVEDDWTIGRLVLTGGLRADRYRIMDGYYRAYSGSTGALVADEIYPDRADWEVSYRAGVAFDATDALRLRAAAYSGLRLPTLNELYRPFVVFPVTTEANAALENERLEGFEAGVDWRPMEGASLSLTAFDNKVKDAITNVTLEPNLRQRRNIDAIDAQGVELGGQLELGQVSFDGTLAYTDATMSGTGLAADLDGFRPSQTPKWAASATLGWHPREGWNLAATLRHVGRQYEDDQETDVLPAATTVDLFAQVPLARGVSFVGRVENLFDEEIVTRNQGGSMDLGTPLTVWGGFRYGF
ncbi:TonB-dependent receptor [Altererythrobacter sp. B11]|uniref:TonB-dependent receptor plug domain-containing protein n=1 Tax=Altererythrobacter sp. B11 TaxID=2060312 RepID=UPI000DC6F2E9|nr:TonB-dependent receptor [Altererythrobacter sp. B11]BBC71943.1 TonB-dependent receptor [Altererythrobacter sp. B11]